MIVRGARRIAMLVLAEDALAPMLGRVIVHGDKHRLARRNPRQDGLGQHAGQGPQRLASPTENAVITAEMARHQRPHRPSTFVMVRRPGARIAPNNSNWNRSNVGRVNAGRNEATCHATAKGS